MTQEKLKQFLDACFDAKRLIEKLPDLPDGMKPRQVHVLDAVNEIQKKQGFCRVSDISSYMNTTSITKLVQELEERNLLVKQADEKDKRVINLTLTEEGKEFVELRVTHFHGEWASRLPDLDDAVVDEFVHAITRMQETMPGIKGVKSNGKNVVAGTRVSVTSVLTLVVGNGLTDDDMSEEDSLETEWEYGEEINFDENSNDGGILAE